MKINSEERKQGFQRLTNMGNFRHNTEVLKKGVGQLILIRRSSADMNLKPSDFLPCVYCLGFFRKAELWRHAKKCGEQEIHSPTACGKALLASATLDENKSIWENKVLEILAKCQQDAVLDFIKKDSLLLRFAATKYSKLVRHSNYDLIQRLRSLARLCMYVGMSMTELLDSSNFDAAIEGIESMCGLAITETCVTYKIPSLAKRLGGLLSKMCATKKVQGMRQKDPTMREEATSFKEMLDLEYTDRVACAANLTLRTRSLFKP